MSPMQPGPGRSRTVRILMYHHVGPFSRPRKQLGLYCHVERFRQQMAWLHRSHLSVISLRQAREGLFAGGELPAASVVLTFDDGFSDFGDHAWPILQEYRFPATLFAVAGKLGQAADWLSDSGLGSAQLMSASTLAALADKGLDVGSHSLRHQRLGLLPVHEQRREIEKSKQRLQDTLGREVLHFCYPYGHYNAAVRDQVIDAGYKCALTCIRDRADRAANAFELPRQGISFKDNSLRYAWKLRFANAIPVSRKEAQGD